jgi:hypothetical protein
MLSGIDVFQKKVTGRLRVIQKEEFKCFQQRQYG